MNMFLINLVLIIFAYKLCHAEPTADLDQGVVRGTYRKSYFGRKYSAFTGIPYAEPPIEALRFEEPKPASRWKGELIADQSYICKQLFNGNILGTEDCLYINVFVPRENLSSHDNLSVVVHIHGGAFRFGSSKNGAQPDFIMDKELVYVTFNYRLGVLGFLSTDDEIIPGNNGLKDQVLALKWIRDNINKFGGNPNSVTLTGFSAGAASVHYHYLSPMSTGLFHRGYSQSGTALNPWALVVRPLQDAEILSNVLNCSFKSLELLQCLRNTPIDILMNATKTKSPTRDLLIFGPVIEKGSNPFLPEHPYILMDKGNIYDVPWISTVVRDEGLSRLSGKYSEQEISKYSTNWLRAGSGELQIYHNLEPELLEDTMDKIKKFYFNNSEISLNTFGHLLKVICDRDYFHDVEIAIRTQSAKTKSPVYFYFFEFLPENQKEYGKTEIGISHGTDVSLIFKFLGMKDQLEPQEAKMMVLLTTFMEKFASTGKVQLGETVWKPIAPNEKLLNVLDIKSPGDIAMVKWKELAPNAFWDSLPIKEHKKLMSKENRKVVSK